MAKVNQAVEAMAYAKPKKKMPKRRIFFIICCCILPVLHWLLFYIIGNGTSFTMAFTNKHGEFSFDNFVRI